MFQIYKVDGLIRLMKGKDTGAVNLGNLGEFTMIELAKTVKEEGAIVIDDFRVCNGARVLNNCVADGVDPIFLPLFTGRDEVHGGVGDGKLEGARLVQDVLGAF
ncbi:hypothetical protein QN277_009398 [Acacia crassicarpa]|uniref:Uncharacterized protein n=1 Tax=Acacia crassicarpa TaxID=499986 RepID=A0AAE1IN29_9FABA|nr:hypothetical protein QN277_009398 [Acacia crassicarpa]